VVVLLEVWYGLEDKKKENTVTTRIRIMVWIGNYWTICFEISSSSEIGEKQQKLKKDWTKVHEIRNITLLLLLLLPLLLRFLVGRFWLLHYHWMTPQFWKNFEIFWITLFACPCPPRSRLAKIIPTINHLKQQRQNSIR
jgi:hypothetical protein